MLIYSRNEVIINRDNRDAAAGDSAVQSITPLNECKT